MEARNLAELREAMQKIDYPPESLEDARALVGMLQRWRELSAPSVSRTPRGPGKGARQRRRRAAFKAAGIARRITRVRAGGR